MPRLALCMLYATLCLACFTLLTIGGEASAGVERPAPSVDALAGIARAEAWYDDRPELIGKSGSGWKPLQRLRWLLETRISLSEESPSVLRQRAFEERQARAAQRAAGGPSWFLIGPIKFSGRTNDISFHPGDPSIVYVGTGGGVWKSTDGGDTWTPKTDMLPVNEIGAILVLPWDANTVLIGTGAGNGTTILTSQGGSGTGPFGIGILKSTDAGETWNATSHSTPVGGTDGFHVFAANPTTHTILAGANDGLYRSTDDGDTWTQVDSEGSWFDVKWQPGNPTRVYASKAALPFGAYPPPTIRGVHVSNDDGLTFALAGTGQPTGDLTKIKIGVTAADPDMVYAHYGELGSTHATLGVYRSTDAGATWMLRNDTLNMAVNQSWYNQVLAVDPDDADIIVTGGVRLYRSLDGGQTYSPTPPGGLFDPFGSTASPHVDFHAIAYEPGSNDVLWVGTDGGVWRSTNDGVSWLTRREGLATYQMYDICLASGDIAFMLGAAQDNGFPRRVGVTEWLQTAPFSGDGMVCRIDPASFVTIIASEQNGAIKKSTDAGESWTSAETGISGNAIWVNPLAMDPNDGSHLYTRRSNAIFRSTNGASSWQQVGTQSARDISISPVDGNVIWTLSNFAGVWLSTNDGDTWTQSVSYPGTALETTIHAHPTEVGTAFVLNCCYDIDLPHIVRTTDFGETWEDVTGDFPDQPAGTFAIDPALPDHWYLGSDTGVWRSTDGGSSWLPFGDGLANGVVTDLEINRTTRKLVAGTYGRGAWEIDLQPAAGVADAEVPTPGLMFDPPLPNPSGSRFVFRFAAHDADAAQLDVFDVAGRHVASVAEARGDGVIRVVEWNAESVPAGIYIAVLDTGDRRLSRKVVVAR